MSKRTRVKYLDDAHRVQVNIKKAAETGCWVWQLALEKSGYGRVLLAPRRKVLAHRFSYETFVGPVPDGLELDHLCRNRACVNPGHLEPVTSRTNILRSPISLAGINAARTHCKHGHPFDDENTIRRISPRNGQPQRNCRTCLRRAQQRHYARTKAERKALRAASVPSECAA